MAYDPELDETIFEDHVESDHPSGQQWIEFKVCRYNAGDPKLQLTRASGNGMHAKLGRMTKGEIERIRDKMTELLAMDLDEIETPRLQDKRAKEADDRRPPPQGGSDDFDPDGHHAELPPDSEIPF